MSASMSMENSRVGIVHYVPNSGLDAVKDFLYLLILRYSSDRIMQKTKNPLERKKLKGFFDWCARQSSTSLQALWPFV